MSEENNQTWRSYYNAEKRRMNANWSQLNPGKSLEQMPKEMKNSIEQKARNNATQASLPHRRGVKNRKLPRLKPRKPSSSTNSGKSTKKSNQGKFELPPVGAIDKPKAFELPPIDEPKAKGFELPPVSVIDAEPPAGETSSIKDLCEKGDALKFSDVCPGGSCPGTWSYRVESSNPESGLDAQVQGATYSAFKADWVKHFSLEDDPDVSVHNITATIDGIKFDVLPAAADTALGQLTLADFICDETEYGTTGGTKKTGFLDPQIDDSDIPKVSDIPRPDSGQSAVSAETYNRSRFYNLATEVTGVENKEEAVRIIQRALVDMGLRIDKLNAFGATSIGQKQPAIKLPEDLEAVEEFQRRFAGALGRDDAAYGNDKARWPEDDDKFSVDGIPGERTRNAVMRFQYLQKDTTSGSSKLGATGPKKDGVDGIVGPLTWPYFVHNKNQGNIKSLKPLNDGAEQPRSEEGGLTNRYPKATKKAVDSQVNRAIIPPFPTPEARNQEVEKRVKRDSKLDYNLMFTGIESFDKKIKISFEKGKLLNMATRAKNIGLTTQTGQISREFDSLMYDAYSIYENLDGLGSGDEGEVREIIKKYFHDVDLYVQQASQDGDGDAEDRKLESLNRTGWGLFGSDDKYFFKGHALYYAYNGRLLIEEDTDSGDLIRWLYDDGFEKEAKIVKTRLAAEAHIARRLYSTMRRGNQLDVETMEGMLRRSGDLQRLENQGEGGPSLGRSSQRPGLSGQGNATRRSQTVTGDPRELKPLEFPETNFVFDPETKRFRPVRPGEN